MELYGAFSRAFTDVRDVYSTTLGKTLKLLLHKITSRYISLFNSWVLRISFTCMGFRLLKKKASQGGGNVIPPPHQTRCLFLFIFLFLQACQMIWMTSKLGTFPIYGLREKGQLVLSLAPGKNKIMPLFHLTEKLREIFREITPYCTNTSTI